MADSERVEFDAGSPAEWARWLEVKHDAATQARLRLFNKSEGEVPLSYGEAVEIALCFGVPYPAIQSVQAQEWLVEVEPGTGAGAALRCARSGLYRQNNSRAGWRRSSRPEWPSTDRAVAP
jgi:hypothetical protein